MSEIRLLVPRLAVDPRDPFTTGIVYMPAVLAYFAAYLSQNGLKVNVTDCFADAPREFEKKKSKIFVGMQPEQALNFDSSPTFIGIYANQVANHESVLELIEAAQRLHPNSKLLVLENAQAVTSYNLTEIADSLFEVGVQAILGGDLEASFTKYANMDHSADHRIVLREFLANAELSELPAPAWEKWNLESYWNLPFGHGPKSNRKYMPIVTSRGCPYPCNFCVVPSTNLRRWRGRDPESVVRELEILVTKFGIKEFHLEDLDPTVNDKRTQEICRLIIASKLDIVLKIVAGTKVETIKSYETVRGMRSAGFQYVSISPETGSKRLLKLINKPFDVGHAENVIKWCRREGIHTQACFVLGFPGETKLDILLTAKMILSLTYLGIGEIAIFIVTPIPGTSIVDKFKLPENLSDLTFSPTWRSDYRMLNTYRLALYSMFLVTKMVFHPINFMSSILRFIKSDFQLKMEMVPRKALWYRKKFKQMN